MTYKYTEKEYNDYGWARANDILTASENERLRSLFAMATTKQSKPPQTSRGEMMFAVGEEVDNKVVFMKGTIENPQITKIIEFYLYDEMELDVERRKTYGNNYNKTKYNRQESVDSCLQRKII